MEMRTKYGFIKAALIISLYLLSINPTWAAEGDSVVVIFNSENKLWNATFFNKTRVEYKTLDVNNTIIGAINTILLEARENTHIDILSPGTFTVQTEDALGGIAPLSGQTIDFHNNEIEIINPLGLRMNGIHAVRKNDVTIKNFRLSGHVTYGIWTKGSNNLTLDNLDIDISPESGLAVFIRPRGNDRPRNLTIKGDVYINGGFGHSIEFTSIDTVNIGDLTVSNNIGGCGINASGSTHITIGNIYGYKNCYSLEGKGGGYATLRYSNAGQHLTCTGVYSRRCGRGFFVTEGDNSALPNVTGQHYSTVNMVDIKHTVRENIVIHGILPTNNHVLSGTVSESLYNPNNNVAVDGASNSVTLGIPDVTIDANISKMVRINELRFGFYDLTGDKNSENYIRDRNCDGFGYAKTVDIIGAFMEWNIKSGNGDHNFNWRYACKNTKKAKLLLNGKYIKTLEFTGTGSDSIWQTITMNVNGIDATEIKNIRLIALEDKGLPLVDYLDLEAPGVTYSLKDFATASDSTTVKIGVNVDIPAIFSKSIKAFNIYPNPNYGVFTIEVGDGLELPYGVHVYDISGALVQHTETVNGHRIAVKLIKSEKGLYLVKISSKNDVQTFRMNCL